MKVGSLVVIKRGTNLPPTLWQPTPDESTIYTIRNIIPKERVDIGERKDVAEFEEGDMIVHTCAGNVIHYGVWLENLIEIQPPIEECSFAEEYSHILLELASDN